MGNEKMRVVGKLKFDTNDIIGRGGFSIVFRGFYSLRPVAIKRMQRVDVNDDESVIQREVELMQKASDHENILRFIHKEMNEDFLFIATELCRGTLEDYVKKKYKKPILFESEEEILSQITQGLAHLHKLEIVHRDIKPRNILIFIPDGTSGTKPVMKLADFGISKMLKADKTDFTNTSLTNPHGTKGWIAPEAYEEKRIDLKVDVWALGCIFAYTLSGGKHPFGDDDIKRLYLMREETMLMVQTDMKGRHQLDSQAFPLIKSMLRPDPSKRPKVEDVLKHPFFINKDRMGYFERLWSSFIDILPMDGKGQLEEMLQGNGIIKSKFESDYTPLHVLCNYYKNENLIDLVIILIEKGADVNDETKEGETSLHLLCSHYEKDNIKAIAQLLIDNGADVNAENGHGYTPLHFLCQNEFKSNQIFNRMVIFQLLIKYGADVNAKDKFGQTLLHLLFENGNKSNDLVDIVRLLIENGVDVNFKNENGWAPLHFLCRNKRKQNIRLIHLLIKADADVNVREINRATPLHLLCTNYQNKDLEYIVRFLINRCAANVNAKDKDGWTPLHFLCCNYKNYNLVKIVQFLIVRGANVNAKDNQGNTPLHILCRNYKKKNLIDIVLFLLVKGSDAKDKHGNTPLHILCRNYKNDNLIDIVKLLIECGADVNTIDDNGNTPLHVLCSYYKNDNLIGIVQLLLQNYAIANAKNKKGKTPLHLLCRCYKIDNPIKEDKNLRSLVHLFLQNGASMNEKDNEGTSPNDYVIRRNKTVLANEFTNLSRCSVAVDLFLENEASMNEKDNEGTTPNDYLINRKKNMLAMEFPNRATSSEAVDFPKDSTPKYEKAVVQSIATVQVHSSLTTFKALPQETLPGPSSAHDGDFIRPDISRKRKRSNHSIDNVHQNSTQLSNNAEPVTAQVEPAVSFKVPETASTPQLNQEQITSQLLNAQYDEQSNKIQIGWMDDSQQ